MTAPLSETNPASTEEMGSQPGIPAHQQQQGALDQPMVTEVTGLNHDPEPATSVPSGSTPSKEIDRLRGFLIENFGDAATPVLRPEGEETTVDVAIRLLTAKQPEGRTCGEEFCNKPEGHPGTHGWVNR